MELCYFNLCSQSDLQEPTRTPAGLVPHMHPLSEIIWWAPGKVFANSTLGTFVLSTGKNKNAH